AQHEVHAVRNREWAEQALGAAIRQDHDVVGASQAHFAQQHWILLSGGCEQSTQMLEVSHGVIRRMAIYDEGLSIQCHNIARHGDHSLHERLSVGGGVKDHYV